MTTALPTDTRTTAIRRCRIIVRGVVQGVGFRPFVHRLATEMGLAGGVENTPDGALIEIEGASHELNEFIHRLKSELPPPGAVHHLQTSFAPPVGLTTFEIRRSKFTGPATALVLPDLATCPDCLAEVFDPSDRRHRYPFTNCTHCGPRFTILSAIPYDRANTSMHRFRLCPACQAEYDDPADRRFHAQPNACPACGPHLELWNEIGAVLAMHDDALLAAASAVRTGRIVAVKGIGGFHLVVDARNEKAVERLRRRKHREEKPLAVMMPNLEVVESYCEVSEEEARLLRSPAAPIVLLRRRASAAEANGLPSVGFDAPRIAPSVAPNNPHLGVMLPYSPLHHLLLNELDFPVVATSGNRSDEPICTDEREALRRLDGIADCFLVHDRPIVRPVDDSVVRVALGREMVLRRARGYAPLPVPTLNGGPCVLAVGAHLKNTVALAVGDNVFLSQHVGDLETPEAADAFERAADALQQLYAARPTVVACDLHPDYFSSQFARRLASDPVRVQHHHAHVAAVMAEHGLDGEVLGVCWDGTGYGPDGTVWGGEFLLATPTTFTRVAHLRTFPLPGGDRAAREPRRAAVGALYEAFGPAALAMDGLPPIRAFSTVERKTLLRMIERGLNAPRTSSMGRLFDAVAAMLDIRQISSFEGQAAMELEFAAGDVSEAPPYPFEIDSISSVLDWTPMLRAIVGELRSPSQAHGPKSVDLKARIAARFQRTLIDMILAVALRHESLPVVLTGGCFQNVALLESAVRRLQAAGRAVYWPRLVPPNDGGIALGQAVIARNMSIQQRSSLLESSGTREAR